LRILQEHYGVPATSVTYRTGGLHAPGRVDETATLRYIVPWLPEEVVRTRRLLRPAELFAPETLEDFVT
jgi:hypothetical protein